MGWLFIISAAFCEIAGTCGLKLFSQQKTFPHFGLFVGGFFFSFLLMYCSLQYLTISTAYTVWVGLGTAGAVLFNMVVFGESKNRNRLLSLFMIIIGVIGLKILA